VGTISAYPSSGYGPIDVDVVGNLFITAGGVLLLPLVDGSVTAWAGHFWPVSSNITGTVSGSMTYTGTNIVIKPATSSFPPALIFNPPGYVFFNSTEIWPDLPSFSSTVYAMLVSACKMKLRIFYENTDPYRFVSVDKATPLGVYAYHPLTPTDSSAFEDIVLDVGAYEFIENNINLKKTLPFYFGGEEEKKKKKKKQENI